MNCSLLIKLSFCLVICALNFRLKSRVEKWLNFLSPEFYLSVWLNHKMILTVVFFFWELVFRQKSISNICPFFGKWSVHLSWCPYTLMCLHHAHDGPFSSHPFHLGLWYYLGVLLRVGLLRVGNVELCVLFAFDFSHWNCGRVTIQKVVFLKHIVYFPWILVWRPFHLTIREMVKYGSWSSS